MRSPSFLLPKTNLYHALNQTATLMEVSSTECCVRTAIRYNQFAFNTLSRVTPVSHGVCNVVKRVCIIGASVLFFGNKLTDQTKLGTAIALIGTYLYTEASKKYSKGDYAEASFYIGQSFSQRNVTLRGRDSCKYLQIFGNLHEKGWRCLFVHWSSFG